MGDQGDGWCQTFRRQIAILNIHGTRDFLFSDFQQYLKHVKFVCPNARSTEEGMTQWFVKWISVKKFPWTCKVRISGIGSVGTWGFGRSECRQKLCPSWVNSTLEAALLYAHYRIDSQWDFQWHWIQSNFPWYTKQFLRLIQIVSLPWHRWFFPGRTSRIVFRSKFRRITRRHHLLGEFH